jgi:hypothetical protein
MDRNSVKDYYIIIMMIRRLISEMEPVRIFDDRYRYRSKPVRPDRTGRSTGTQAGLKSRPVPDRPVTGTGSISG